MIYKLRGVLRSGLVAIGVAALLAVSTGCAGRTLAIVQEDRINDEMHRGRPNPTGEPLELTIVCITPADLEHEQNDLLNPTSGITSKQWYSFRPDTHSRNLDLFKVPRDQVYVLTDEAEGDVYGRKKGPALRGAARDSRGGTVTIRGIAFPGMRLHSKKSVIYVFPRFIGADWEVLPVAPIKFNPPGAYSSKLSCKIGTRDTGGAHRQYIEGTTSRRLHGRAKDSE